MKIYKGFAALLNAIERLPETGWIFVDADFKKSSRKSIEQGIYYVAENDDEEIVLENTKETLVECPIFLDMKSVKDKKGLQVSLEGYIGAVIFYMENDDFEE